ncbi:MAG: hypothetical protein HFE76_11515 [Firmicutes bacterium]|nr:hypothetical protein [Bacillota bacterium]
MAKIMQKENVLDYHLLERYPTERAEVKTSSATDWNPVNGCNSVPVNKILYITVVSQNAANHNERILIEGYVEDDKWFDAEGRALKPMGYEPLAWIIKELPEIYMDD